MDEKQLEELIKSDEIQISDIIEVKNFKSNVDYWFVISIVNDTIYVYKNTSGIISDLQSLLDFNRIHVGVKYSLLRLHEADNARLSYVINNFIDIIKNDSINVYYEKLDDFDNEKECFDLSNYEDDVVEYLSDLIGDKMEGFGINNDYMLKSHVEENKIIIKLER